MGGSCSGEMASSQGGSDGWVRRGSWGELARRGSKSAGESFTVMGAREALKAGEQRRHRGVGVSEDTGS